MSVGVAFASTGGQKILRAVRSFRKMEPDLKIHVVFDISSKTWQSSKEIISKIPRDVEIACVENRFHINGTLNAAMRWMKARDYSHGCLFHDDLIFSPLLENRGYVSNWFKRLETEEVLQNTSGLGFGTLEVLYKNPGNTRYQPGHWDAPPEVWDAMDLESEELWRKLIVDGKPVATVEFETFYVDYTQSGGPLGRCGRLGPVGQIVPMSAWEAVGGFDETFGVHYDSDYPAACVLKGLPPVLCLPETPFLHLHNQSIGYKDPSVDLWGDVSAAFERKYGKDYGKFWKDENLY